METALVDTQTSLKAVVSRKDLFEGVGTVGHAVSGRTSLPILNHVLIKTMENSLYLMASDSELTIALTIPAVIEEQGTLTAPSKLLTELLGTLPESSVALSVDRSNAVRVHCDKSDYKILGLPAIEYPKKPEVPNDTTFKIGQRVLRDMIRQTIFAVSPDEARAILTGIFFVFDGVKLTCVATDTHRLAVRSANVADGIGAKQVIVPSRAMNELQRILMDAPGDVVVRISDNQILFETPPSENSSSITLITNLIQGTYPNYHRVIPEGFTRKITLQTAPFQKAVRRAAIVARNNAHRIILRSNEDKLTITAESSMEGAAYEEVDFIREGQEVEIAFNAKYMLDVLGTILEEGLVLELTDSLKPGIVRPVRANEEETAFGDFLCILMPMQIM